MTLIKLGFDRDRLKDLAAGAGAGAAASLVVAPLDAIKDTQKQYQNINRNVHHAKHPTSMTGVAKELWNTGRGIKGKINNFYRGTGTAMLKVAPMAALQFMLYGFLKDKLRSENKKS
jgi:hypothetical protein